MANRYNYRGLGMNIADDDTRWCIVGTDIANNSDGILEWCYDREDAQRRLSKMQRFSQFNNLQAMSYRTWSGDDD